MTTSRGDGAAISELPDALRALAASLEGDDWEHPLCSVEACGQAAEAIELLQSLLAGESADIDTIVAELDRRAEADPQYKWDVWRTAMKPARWCVKINADAIDDTSLPGVLRQALHYRAVLRIPRRPEVYRPEDFAVVRDGSKWTVKCRGQFFFGNQPTKRRAAEAVERMCSLSREQADEWDRLHGPTVAAGTEGIDYRYQP